MVDQMAVSTAGRTVGLMADHWAVLKAAQTAERKVEQRAVTMDDLMADLTAGLTAGLSAD